MLGIFIFSTMSMFATTVEVTSFTAVNDNLDENISYTTAKNDGTSNPGIYSGEIRLYQDSNGKNGGSITITAKSGYTITAITIGSSMKTTVKYQVDSEAEVTGNSIAANGKLTVPDITATSVKFTCLGKDKNSRFCVNYISVTYQADGPVAANAQFEDVTVKVGETANITYTPADLGEVTYSIDPEGIATIAEGVVTGIAKGQTIVTATWATGEKYEAGTTTFTVNVEGSVANPVIAPETETLTVIDNVSIAVETEGAAISYAVVDEGAPEPTEFTAYSEPFTLPDGNKTVYAKASLGDQESAVVSRTYTVTKCEAGLAFAEPTYVAYIEEGTSFAGVALTNPNNLAVNYTSDKEGVATVDNTGAITLVAAGTATITAAFAGDATYKAQTVSYVLTVMAERPMIATFDFAQVGTTGKDKYGMSTETNDGNNPISTTATTITEPIGAIDVTMTIEGRHRNWGGKLRLQKESGSDGNGGYFTLSVPEHYVITEVKFSEAAALNAEPGTYSAGQTHTWTPAEGVETNSIKFTKTQTSNVDIHSFTVSVAAVPYFADNAMIIENTGITLDGVATTDFAFTVGNYTGGKPEITVKVLNADGAEVATTDTKINFTEEPAEGPARAAATVKDFKGTVETRIVEPGAEGTNYKLEVTASYGNATLTEKSADTPTAVEGIVVDNNAPAEYYNLQGVRVANPAGGVYIRVSGGKATKVYLR